jgi:2'-5' RNA ligase
MPERLFFALWPPPEVRQSLLDVREQAAGRAGLGTPLARMRYTHADDLHLTLVFVGAVQPQLIACIEAAGDAVVLDEFVLGLREAICWPRQRLWVAQPAYAPGALLSLVGQLNRQLSACGFEPERRRYRAHLTLARRAPEIAPVAFQVDWTVGEFVLAASCPGHRPRYRVARRWALRAARTGLRESANGQ